MTNNKNGNSLPLPILLFFCVTTTLFLLGKKQLQQWHVDQTVLIAGNILLAAVTIISYFLYKRAMAHPTTMGFLRNTYSGLFLKLMVCAFAVIIYVMTDREHVNKPAIISCVALYFVYTLLEMRSLMQWNKERRNA